MHCKGCGREPDEINEYIQAAEEYPRPISPEEYVRVEEGTYDYKTDSFYCTVCYVKAGMPLNKER